MKKELSISANMRALSWIAWSVLGWALLLLRHGYTFGVGDHAEILPYIQHMHNPALYANDFYVSHIAAIIPNVRWFFVLCMQPFAAALPFWFFVFHALYTLLLLGGTLQVCKKLGVSYPISFAGIMCYLGLVYGLTPGGNEWYLNNFQAENIAFVLGIWSLYGLLHKRPYWAFMGLALATFFHPLAGIQFAVLLAAAGLFAQQLNWKPLLMYMSTGGLYFVWILLQHSSNLDSPMQNLDFFSLLFEFRQPHHSLPSYYATSGLILSALLGLAALRQTYKKKLLVFWVMVWIILGCGVYTLGVLFFRSALIAQTQWFKTLALHNMLGIALLFQRGLGWLKLPLYPSRKTAFFLLFCGLGMVSLLGLVPGANIAQKPLHYLRAQTPDKLMAISQQLDSLLPPQALLIQPFGADAVHYYSRRGSYVSFKAVVHERQALQQWYKRIQQVYGLSTADGGGYALQAKADAFYIKSLQEARVTYPADYALAPVGHYAYPVVWKNTHFVVLKLK